MWSNLCFLLLVTIARGQNPPADAKSAPDRRGDNTGIKCYNAAYGVTYGCQSCSIISMYSQSGFPPAYFPECLSRKPSGDELAKAEKDAADVVGNVAVSAEVCFTDLCNSPGLARRSWWLLIAVIFLLAIVAMSLAAFLYFYKTGRIWVEERKKLFKFMKNEKEEENENAGMNANSGNDNAQRLLEKRRRKQERRERRERRRQRKERKEREKKEREEGARKDPEKAGLLDPSNMP